MYITIIFYSYFSGRVVNFTLSTKSGSIAGSLYDDSLMSFATVCTPRGITQNY